MNTPSPLADPGIVANPYPTYASLSEHAPVHWCDGLDAWAVLRHADCATILKSSKFKAERMEEVLLGKFPDSALPADSIYHRFTKNVMMYTDPPLHTRLRRSAQPGFTRAAHEHYSQVIRRVAAALVAGLPSGPAELDAITALAAKLPVSAAVHAFGVPEEDLGDIIPQVDRVMTYWSGPRDQPIPLDVLLDSLSHLHTYAGELLQGRRGTVGPDTVIARLAASQPGNVDSTMEQTLHQLVLLLIALFAPTTPGSLGSGMLAFANNPIQIERFRAQPRYADTVGDEVVRYNASNQFTWRVATETMELQGQKIEVGQKVAVFLGAANRDPRVFERPDEFDLDRPNSDEHLSFGAGLHSCLGRQIASLEIKWLFVELLARFPALSIVGEPEWNSNLEFRSLRCLPLRLG